MVIQTSEVMQLTKWVLLWVGSWFVAFNLREIIAVRLPDPFHQILFGVGVLLVVAYIWDIKRYSGRG